MSTTELKEAIRKMAREKNAVIMAHYYVDGQVQDIADFIGDSLALAQQAAKKRFISIHRQARSFSTMSQRN